MSPLRPPVVALALVSAAALLGCGADSGPETTARAALERVVAGDSQGLCGLLSTTALERVHDSDGSVSGCRREAARHPTFGGAEDAEIEIGDSTVPEESGSPGTVEATVGSAGNEEGATVLVVQEAAGWKVDDVEFDSAAAAVDSAAAKATARAAQTAVEAYAASNGGSYAGATVKELSALVPSLEGEQFEVSAAADSYEVGARSQAGPSFSLARGGKAAAERLICAPAGEGDCPGSGKWG